MTGSLTTDMGDASTPLAATVAAALAPPAPHPLTPRPAAVSRPDEPSEPTPADAALVKFWHARVLAAKKHWAVDFKRMRADQDFAAGKQHADQTDDDDRYMVNLVHRHINDRVAALYARQPTFIAKRRSRLDFLIWDGEPASIQAALQNVTMSEQSLAMGGQPIPPDPNAVALLQDVVDGYTKRKMLGKVGKTLEILFHYSMGEQLPKFKESMKQLVRRVLTCGVGYLKLNYQRLMAKKPDTEARISDFVERLAHIESLQADLAEGEIEADDPQAAELRLALEQLRAEEEIIVREGLTFGFPLSTAIIPSPRTRNLKTWLGADWVAEEFVLTTGEIQDIYGIDVGDDFMAHTESGELMAGWRMPSGDGSAVDKEAATALVYEVRHRVTGLVYPICVGYKGFLKKPFPPVEKLERFYPWFAISFNDIEHEKKIFPPSDVRLMRSPQSEYNRTMEARRQHRIANRPLYISPKGSLEEEDRQSLSGHAAHDVIELSAVQPGQNAAELLQPLEKTPIDPNLYESETVFQDVGRAVGNQITAPGGQADASATSASISETGRVSTLSSNADDLDEVLTDVGRCSGQVLLAEMDTDTVFKIVGPGAVWPTLSALDIAEEIGLEVQAGSSGRPNKAQDIANFERVAPFLLQTPGISPAWMAKIQLRLLDDPASHDIEEAIIDGIASIVAQNSQKQPAPADPGANPAQQGGQGALNAPSSEVRPGGPQPAFPADAGQPAR